MVAVLTDCACQQLWSAQCAVCLSVWDPVSLYEA